MCQFKKLTLADFECILHQKHKAITRSSRYEMSEQDIESRLKKIESLISDVKREASDKGHTLIIIFLLIIIGGQFNMIYTLTQKLDEIQSVLAVLAP